MEGVEGLTAIDTRLTITGLTVRRVLPLTVPLVAVMVVFPELTLAAMPVELIVATPAADEPQVDVEVMSLVVPSLKCPVAVNCCVAPAVTVGFVGPTVMDCKVAGWAPPPPPVELPPPPQPESNAMVVSVAINKSFFIPTPWRKI
jgi:hypothetical protein